jgi:hypothetical protein
MRRILGLALGLAVAMTAQPVDAQLFNMPNYGSPSGTPATWLSANYGRGLNDASGKQDAYGIAVGRRGIGNRATVSAGVAMIDSQPDSEWTFGGTVGVALLPAGGSAQVSVQGGIGYLSVDVGTESATSLHFPIGVSLRTTIEGPTATVAPWIMPRLSVVRYSLGSVSDTSSDFGVSGGFSVTLPSGFGVHTALDLLAADDSAWLLGVGLHYLIS